MKITIFNLKGGQGKTSITLALALEYGFFVITNDEYSPIDKVLPKGNVKHLSEGEKLPSIPDDVSLIYDFGGRPDVRVIDAVKLSDWVIVPVIYNSPFEMHTTIQTIGELERYTKKIIIVVNRAEKDSLKIASAVLRQNFNYPIFEIKKTTAFARIMKEGKSITELMKIHFFARIPYKIPAQQIESIKQYLDKA